MKEGDTVRLREGVKLGDRTKKTGTVEGHGPRGLVWVRFPVGPLTLIHADCLVAA